MYTHTTPLYHIITHNKSQVIDYLNWNVLYCVALFLVFIYICIFTVWKNEGKRKRREISSNCHRNEKNFFCIQQWVKRERERMECLLNNFQFNWIFFECFQHFNYARHSKAKSRKDKSSSSLSFGVHIIFRVKSSSEERGRKLNETFIVFVIWIFTSNAYNC